MKVCCRVDVRDRFGVWSALTEDIGPRGCRLVSARLPRLGSVLELGIWSDLFPELLDVTAEAAWASDCRIGAKFVSNAARPGALSPAEWIARLVECGRVMGPEPIGADAPRVVPVVRRLGVMHPVAHGRAVQDAAPARDDARDGVLAFPARNR